jgi:hypothetical protein
MCTGAIGELPAQDTRGATARRGPHRCGIPAKGCESNMRGYQRAVREDGLTIVGSGPAGQDQSGRRERSPRLLHCSRKAPWCLHAARPQAARLPIARAAPGGRTSEAIARMRRQW